MSVDGPASNGPLRVAVIGGGLSGLTAAWELDRLATQTGRAISITLFEASSRYGGVFGSQRIDDYLVETGADSFITNKPWGMQLVKDLGLEDQLISTNARYRRSLILHRGKPVETPAGFNLLAPTQIWPMLMTPLLSWKGKLRALQEAFIPKKPEMTDESLASFVRRRFGNELLERIAQPMVGGIYTSDPEKLSLLATLPRFLEMEQNHGSVIRALRLQNKNNSAGEEKASGARYSLFMSLKDGMSTLQDALAKPIQQRHELQLNTKVVSLKASGGCQPPVSWNIEFSDGEIRCFDAVILAVPTYVSAGLLSSTDVELSGQLNQIEYASTAIVVSGHRLADSTHPLNAFGLVIPAIEKRDILATSFLSRKFEGRAPDGKVICRTFVGGAMQAELLQRTEDQIIETVQRELGSIFGLKGEPDFAIVCRWNRSMPQYHIGHLQRVAAIEQRLQTLPNLAMTTNAFHGVGLPEVIKEACEAAGRLLANQG
ncbi:protoporphyrinogen/coproporphyrinogen oxidase [Lacunimicrobium album]